MQYTRIQVSFKGKEILTCATKWMNPGDFILSAISQSQKDKHCMSPLIWFLEQLTIETESRTVVAKGWLGGRMGRVFNGDGSSFGNERSSGGGGP